MFALAALAALAALFAFGVRGLSGAVSNDGSELHKTTGLIGPVVSGSFLFLIGILNLEPAKLPRSLRTRGWR